MIDDESPPGSWKDALRFKNFPQDSGENGLTESEELDWINFLRILGGLQPLNHLAPDSNSEAS